MKKTLSVVISLLLTVGFFIWRVLEYWGVQYFSDHFNFWEMVFPFIVIFLIGIPVIRFIIEIVSAAITHSKLTSAERAELEQSRRKEQSNRIQEQALKRKQKQEAHRAWAEAQKNTPPARPSVVRCPKCGCESVSGNKKGFGVGKAVVGSAIAGPIGLMAGNIGAKKVRVTCLKCGHNWMAG